MHMGLSAAMSTCAVIGGRRSTVPSTSRMPPASSEMDRCLRQSRSLRVQPLQRQHLRDGPVWHGAPSGCSCHPPPSRRPPPSSPTPPHCSCPSPPSSLRSPPTPRPCPPVHGPQTVTHGCPSAPSAPLFPTSCSADLAGQSLNRTRPPLLLLPDLNLLSIGTVTAVQCAALARPLPPFQLCGQNEELLALGEPCLFCCVFSNPALSASFHSRQLPAGYGFGACSGKLFSDKPTLGPCAP